MTPGAFTYDLPPDRESPVVREGDIESGFVERLRSLKYEVRHDKHDRATRDRFFREKFEALNLCLTKFKAARLLLLPLQSPREMRI